jgi:hypothetical protein
MAKFRIISDNYIDAISALSDDLSNVCIKSQETKQKYDVQSANAYDEQVEKDLDRIRYVNFYLNKSEMRRYLKNREDLDIKKLHYTQGDFYAAFSCNIVNSKMMEDGPFEREPALSFCYVNDKNEYCGFYIEPCLAKTETASPKPGQQTYKYLFSHIKNIKKSLEERHATLVMSDVVAPNNCVASPFNKEFGKSIDASDISQELVLMLESSSITQLLSGLIDKQGALNLEKYKEIRDRLGNNIDDRDEKMKIWGQIILWAKLTEKSLTSKDKQDLKASLTEMLTQQDYFQKHTKEDLEAYLKFFKEQRIVSDSLPSRSQQEGFVNSVMGKMDEFLQHKKTDDAEKFNVVKLYDYTSYQEWLDAKKLPLYSRIPHFIKVLGLTVAVGLTLAGLAASGVLIVPVAIALAVAFVGLCSWLAKKVYSLRIDDKKIEEKIATITETNQIEEKTKTAVTEILGDDLAKVSDPKPRVQPSSFFKHVNLASSDEFDENSDPDLRHSSS